MTTVDLNLISTRLDLATKGSWIIGADRGRILDEFGNTLFVYKGKDDQAMFDLKFVAFAKRDVSKLISEMLRLQTELDIAMAQIRELTRS